MITLDIRLNGQALTVKDPPVIAAGSRNRILFRITPDEAWDGLSITMTFRRLYDFGLVSRSISLSGFDEVGYVPYEVLEEGWLYIGAVGVAEDGIERLTTKIVDEPLRIYPAEATSADPAGSVTPEIADQVLAAVGAMSEEISSFPRYRGAADPEEFGGLLANIVRDGFYEIANPELWEDAPLETAFCLRVMQCSEHLMLQTAFPVLSGDIPFCRVVMPRTKDVVRDWWAAGAEEACIVPIPTQENVGQVLSVAADGKPVWSTVMNAEEVGF